ncbi:hypothetical protein C0993_000676 [Termitomyces sp. T159_Od127]|nr:hypothetical protein C0993_000676 [Termitomyces sp. T159_Od127]
MSSMDVKDREFGKGRRNDSSSSPESSPRQAKKRSFSPTSDDGDLVVPPIADDDTPPPSERPLIRQAMAFSSSCTTVAASNTYETVLLPPTKLPHDTLFLPGQEVTLPTNSSRRRTKKTEGPPKKRKKNDYGGQTTRFRLNPRIESTSAEPFMQPLAPLRSISGTSTPAPYPVTTQKLSYERDNIPTALQIPSAQPIPMSAGKSQPILAMQPISSVSRWKTAPRAEGPGPLPSSDLPSLPRPGPPASEVNKPREHYYRRDYEKNLILHEPGPSHGLTYHSPGQPTGAHDDVGSSTRSGGKPPLLTTYRHHEERIREGKRTQKTPLSLLTLLIQDIRSGVIDQQLAEVKVPMKIANDPKDGFWADAKILGQQLQSGASRIDGPAKVYTLRGKYRQFFLRVSADNRDEFISTNLAIKPDRVLDVVVEELLPPGQLPHPPKIPQGLISRSPSPGSTSESLSPERDSVQPRAQADLSYELIMEELEMYRRYHRSFRLSREPESAARGRKSQLKNNTKCKQSPKLRSCSAESIPSSLIPSGIRFQSPDGDSTEEEVDRLITEAVDQIIQEDENWPAFFRAKAAHEPHRAMDVLEQYKIVKHMLDMFVGKKVPFRSFKAKIEPVSLDHTIVKSFSSYLQKHVTQALKIEDPKFYSNCVETLHLLDLYGENGRHYADTRVIEMAKDTGTPEYNAKPIKRLLHLMQDIDKKWKEEHPS